MFENKKTGEGIHYSRYYASYCNVARTRNVTVWRDDFIRWLRTQNLTEQEISDIEEMAYCGKLELENSVRQFINNMKGS